MNPLYRSGWRPHDANSLNIGNIFSLTLASKEALALAIDSLLFVKFAHKNREGSS